MDDEGNVIVSWSQTNPFSLLANRYTASTGWQGAKLVENDPGSVVVGSPVIFDSEGNALFVWVQDDATNNSVWAKQFNAGTEWNSDWGNVAQQIEVNPTTNTEDAEGPHIAVDANGNALAVWAQGGDIWANLYSADTGWGVATLLESGSGNAKDPQIATDANGNAIAVWTQKNTTTTFNEIRANRYIANSGWGSAETIGTDSNLDLIYPKATVDANGNAVVVWYQSGGSSDNVMVNYFQ